MVRETHEHYSSLGLETAESLVDGTMFTVNTHYVMPLSRY
jgi:hypothetical protein